MLDLLPDSRCHQREKGQIGSKMVDWPIGPLNGPTVRLEVAIAYCASCGVELYWVPISVISCTFLCDQCVEEYGHIAADMAMPIEQFFQTMQEEMLEKHGHLLTPEETLRLMEEGRLGSGLEKLARESPIKV